MNTMKLEEALVKAHNSGDFEAATVLAEELKKVRGGQSKSESALKQVSRKVVGDDPLRSIALGSRNLSEGILSLPMMFGDALNSLYNVTLGNMGAPKLPMASESMKGLLTEAGAPVAETPQEKIIGAANRGVGAALSFAPLTMASGIAPVLRAGVPISGGTGAVTEESFRQAGAPEPLAIGAGIVGGAIPDIAGGVYRGVSRMVAPSQSPFTKGGQERIAGNVLARSAASPKAAIQKMDGVTEIIPGSSPTLAEASQDFGLAQLQKGLQNSQVMGAGVGGRLAEREAQQNAARINALRAQFGDADLLKVAEDARAGVAEILYKPAFEKGRIDLAQELKILNDSGVRIADLASKPAFKAAIESAKKIAQNEGIDIGENPEYSIRGLHYIKLAIDDALEKASMDTSIGRNAKRAIMTVKDQTVKVLDSVPEYKLARETFAAQSRPIDQMRLGQKLIESAESAGSFTASGDRKLLLSNLNRFVKNNNEELSKKLDKFQYDTVKRVVADMERGAIAEGMQRVKGSDTFRNMTTASFLGRVLGAEMDGGNIPTDLLRPISFLFKYSDERVMGLLSDAVMDPVLAKELMKKADPKHLERVGQMLQRKATEYTGSAAARQTPFEDQ